MGTNFYLRYNTCNHCGRYDQIHIGKHSSGWRFIFRGYSGIPEALKQLGIYGDDVKSVELWRVLTKKGELYDEYGTPIQYEHFWRMIENFQSLKTDHAEKIYSLDGYDFLFREFS